MKLYLNRILAFVLAISIFLSCSATVYAFPCRLKDGTWIDKPWSEAGEEIWLTIQYGLSQIGVFFANGADFKQWLQNTETYKDLWDENGRLAKHTSIDTKTGTVNYDKEIMSVLKSAVDEYAKEHEPYYMVNTMTLDNMVSAGLKNKVIFDTVSNLIDESKSNIIAFAVERGGSKMFFADIGSDFRNISAVKQGNNQSYVYFYDNETWALNYIDVYRHSVGNEALVYNDFVDTADFIFDNDDDFGVRYIYQVIPFNHNGIFAYEISNYNNLYLITKEKRRIRVFNTYGDFQNYTLGKRNVYYTSNYYNYVPEDLSVTIDDLQKTVDDLSKVIDELLKQIQDNTDESEIEELLRQILEALKNQQGGGGTGGGDVNVDIDLSTTNNWLSKIYTKVSQIFDKISLTVEPPMQDVVTAIEDLSQMLKRYLAEITGDLDDIKGQLENMSEQEVEEKTDSLLSQLMDAFSEISETAKGKFPFSLPSDMQFLIARISGMSPETAASYSYDENTVSSLSFNSDISLNSVSENDGTDHGGGGSSRPGDETEPPGGGGASRPGGSGFVSVEHGGGGSGREPVSSNNWAPVFTLPIVIERYGIEEYIILDMSMFDPVSRMSRTLFLIMYIVCLYNMTFKVMGLWGDLVG